MSDKSEESSDLPKDAPLDSEPEAPDALSASEAAQVMDSIEKNRNKILIGVGAIAIAICGVLVSSQLKKQKHLAAASAYTAAAQSGEVAALDAVVVDHPGSIGAGNALLTKAELQIDQGKPEDARSTLESFIADYQNHPRVAQGVFALGNLYHVSGDLEKAKEFYEQTLTVQPDGELSPLARIRLGDLALDEGDRDAAERRYEESFTQHPGNPFFSYAEEKITLLTVGDTPVVKRPEPEPEVAEPEVAKPDAAAPPAQTDAAAVDAPKPKAGKGKAKTTGSGGAKGKAKTPATSKAKTPGNGKGKAKETASGDKKESKQKQKAPVQEKGATETSESVPEAE
ncbi:MAG: tetratricopeptide repeat protein [Verrucomicrobiota bacterium]